MDSNFKAFNLTPGPTSKAVNSDACKCSMCQRNKLTIIFQLAFQRQWLAYHKRQSQMHPPMPLQMLANRFEARIVAELANSQLN